MDTAQTKTTKPKKASGSKLGIILGILGLIGGIILLTNQIVFSSHSANTTATVVSYELINTSAKGCHYHPQVSFTTANGQKATALLDNANVCDPPATGTAMKISYNTNDPSEAQKSSWGATWGPVVAAFLLGALFLSIGIGSFRSAHKQNKLAQQNDTQRK